MKRQLITFFMAMTVGSLLSQNVAITDHSTFTTPQTLLHLYKNAANGNIMQLSNNTTGTGANDGLMFNSDGTNFFLNNWETGYFGFQTEGTERFRIASTGLGLVQNNSYLNFGSTLGTTGYGFRDYDGVLEYKNNNGSWTPFPAAPSIPGNTEYWIRPTGNYYIRPETNSAVRVYDDGQTYGYYYNGSTNLIAGYFRTTNSTAGACAVQGFSDVSGNQTYGYLGYNGSITVGASTIGGAAVFGDVPDANRTAVYGKTSGTASVAAVLGYSNVWIAGYFWAEDASTTLISRPANYSQLNVSIDKSGNQPAVKGYSNRTAGSGNSGYTIGGEFHGIGGSQDAFGVMAISSTSGSANTETAGGYFSASNSYWGDSYYAYVADNWNGRKITGTGTVSEIVPTENHGRVTLTCPESPEYWYQDYGSVKLVNGKAHVNLDPILADIILVDEHNPLKVFLQVNVLDCQPVVVMNKTATGFDLVESNGGNHSGEIDYQLIAKPKTNYGEGRFPQAPGPAYLKADKEPKAAKAANQIDPSKIFHWPSDHEVYKYNPEDMVPIGEIIPAGPNTGKIKLGNGKYGDAVPANSSNIKQ
jgi:hypothetical protein